MKLIEVSELADYFDNVVSMYAPSNSERGDPLVYLLQDNWGIFAEEFFLADGAASLLEDISMADWDDDSGEPPLDAHELYIRRHPLDYVEKFEMFLDEVRDTQGAEPDFPDILREDIWRYEGRVQAGSTLYRARLGWQAEEDDEKTPWSGEMIGANPNPASSRANRAGQVVLYCADHERTAIAEVRPARGFLVSVCELLAIREIAILDLSRSREVINPFLDGDGQLAYWLELDELLDRIAWALAKPLERDDDPRDYLPSQRLADFAREAHFAGIRYPSAMDSGGTNLVIFDPSTCEIQNPKLVKVTETKLEYTDELWRLTDDFPDF